MCIYKKAVAVLYAPAMEGASTAMEQKGQREMKRHTLALVEARPLTTANRRNARAPERNLSKINAGWLVGRELSKLDCLRSTIHDLGSSVLVSGSKTARAGERAPLMLPVQNFGGA